MYFNIEAEVRGYVLIKNVNSCSGGETAMTKGISY